MLFSALLNHIQALGPLVKTERLISGHDCYHLLTDENQSVNSLPQTLANTLNLIRDGAPIAHAILQIDMHVEPEPVDILACLKRANCAVVFCKLTTTYAIVRDGLFIYYVHSDGITHKCWSLANVRNRYK